MTLELVRLRLKISNAQILCPKSHKLKVIKISKSSGAVLSCNKCQMYYPLPAMKFAFESNKENHTYQEMPETSGTSVGDAPSLGPIKNKEEVNKE